MKKYEKRVSVAILLPSVGRNTSEYQVRVSNDGQALILTLCWQRGMCDPDLLHRVWTDASEDSIKAEGALRSAAFRPMLRQLRANKAENITSPAKLIYLVL